MYPIALGTGLSGTQGITRGFYQQMDNERYVNPLYPVYVVSGGAGFKPNYVATNYDCVRPHLLVNSSSTASSTTSVGSTPSPTSSTTAGHKTKISINIDVSEDSEDDVEIDVNVNVHHKVHSRSGTFAFVCLVLILVIS